MSKSLSMPVGLQYMVLQTKLKFDSMHMQNFIKRTTKKVQHEQKSKLDEIWDNHPECRFDIQKELEEAVLANENKGLPISYSDRQKIKRSNKLVTYVLYHSTNDKVGKLEGTTKAEREFINAVAYELDQSKIYSDDGIADLPLYDPSSTTFMEDPQFITSITKINSRKTTNFEDKAEAAVKVEDESSNKPVEPEKEVTVPFGNFSRSERNTFIPGKEYLSNISFGDIPMQGNLPDEMFKYLEKYLAPVFKDEPFEHRYEIDDNGVLHIYTTNNGEIRDYMIDTGSYYGSTNYAIIYPCKGFDGKDDYQPISIKDRSMMRQILASIRTPDYKDIISSVRKYAIPGGMANFMFDLSHIDLDGMIKADREKFKDNLSKVTIKIKELYAQLYPPVDPTSPDFNKTDPKYLALSSGNVRFRVSGFTNPGNFDFVSDGQMNNQFANSIVQGHNGLVDFAMSGYVRADVLTMNKRDTNQSWSYDLNEKEKK